MRGETLIPGAGHPTESRSMLLIIEKGPLHEIGPHHCCDQVTVVERSAKLWSEKSGSERVAIVTETIPHP